MLCREIRKSVDIQSSRGFYVLLDRDEKNDILFHSCGGRLSFCRGMTEGLLQYISFLRAEVRLKNLSTVKHEGWTAAGAHSLLLMSALVSREGQQHTAAHAGLPFWAMAVGSLLPSIRRKNSPWVSVIRHWLCSSSSQGQHSDVEQCGEPDMALQEQRWRGPGKTEGARRNHALAADGGAPVVLKPGAWEGLPRAEGLLSCM